MKNAMWYTILGCSALLGAGSVTLPGCTSVEELPAEQIRPALREFGGIELPKKADGLRAILARSRDPGIFVRFQTDFEGIGQVESTFAGPGVQVRDLDADDFKRMKKEGTRLFFRPSCWEEKIGVRIHDQDSLGSGREFRRMAPRLNEVEYQVYIDHENKTVYIYAYIFH